MKVWLLFSTIICLVITACEPNRVEVCKRQLPKVNFNLFSYQELNASSFFIYRYAQGSNYAVLIDSTPSPINFSFNEGYGLLFPNSIPYVDQYDYKIVKSDKKMEWKFGNFIFKDKLGIEGCTSYAQEVYVGENCTYNLSYNDIILNKY
jgi:hypothetical protein